MLQRLIDRYDDVLPSALFNAIQTALAEPVFWEEHGYPADAFFSYSLERDTLRTSVLGAVAETIRPLAEKIAGVKTGRVEWWAHKRDTTGGDGGHQLHFDLDEVPSLFFKY